MSAAHYLRTLDDAGTEAAVRAQAVVDPGADAYFVDGSGETPMMPLNRLRLVLSRRLDVEQEKLYAYEQCQFPDSDSGYLRGLVSILEWVIKTIDLILEFEKTKAPRNG